MKERPILFSAPMVRAILDGTKTQTRRIVKTHAYKNSVWYRPYQSKPQEWSALLGDKQHSFVKCPYGYEGDRLWVRETYSFDKPDGGQVFYRADGYQDGLGGWKPSIHMPRHASRIDLKITSIGIEHLQDITRKDAIAEGAPRPDAAYSMRDSYRMLWETINGMGSWAENPWVWVIKFEWLRP